MAVLRPFGATLSSDESIQRRRSASGAVPRLARGSSAGEPATSVMATPWRPPTHVDQDGTSDATVWKKLTAVAAAVLVATLISAVALTTL